MSAIGTWKLTMNTPFGVQTPTLEVKEDNGTLGGTLTGGTGPSPLEDVSVNGSDISFKTKVATPMGSFPVSFKATADGNSMKGVYQTMLGDTEFTGERVA